MLMSQTVTSITFGVAPVSRPLLRPSQARDRVAKQQSRAPSRLSRADKLRNRTSTCYTQ